MFVSKTVQFCHRMEVDPLYIKQETAAEKNSSEDAILLCPNCNQVFRRQVALQAHRKSCDTCLKFIKDGKCGICGWNDQFKSVFWHLRRKHAEKLQNQADVQKSKTVVKLKVKSTKRAKRTQLKKNEQLCNFATLVDFQNFVTFFVDIWPALYRDSNLAFLSNEGCVKF